jgi:hypothetical protein
LLNYGRGPIKSRVYVEFESEITLKRGGISRKARTKVR